MTHVQFLRIKKLTGKGIIEVAARHNHREILAELGGASGGHIDPARVTFNCVLRGQGTAAGVASEAQTLMDNAGVKTLRKDAVRALEIIFSLPLESSIDRDRFFNESVQWVGDYFKAPVISAIVHNDEAAPHCHVLLLPLVDGRMVGSDLMGGRAKLQALQADFYAQVGERHGMTRQAAQKPYSAAIRRAAAKIARDVLRDNGELCATADAVLNELLELVAANPVKLLALMGRAMPTSGIVKGRFVKMMTKPCKPEKPIGFGRKKPAGFDAAAAPENERTLSCVGLSDSAPSLPPPIEPKKGASRGFESSSASIANSTSAGKAASAARKKGDCVQAARTASHSDCAPVRRRAHRRLGRRVSGVRFLKTQYKRCQRFQLH